jgi:reactive intermediate/imine deaminase
MQKQAFSTAEAPSPAARYSQAVRKGNILSVAGQIGIDPGTGKLVSDGIAEQTRQTMRNLAAVLAAAGASLADVIMMRVYVTDSALLSAMNAAYEEFVAEPFPSRTTVVVGLGPGMLVEIDALAVMD